MVFGAFECPVSNWAFLGRVGSDLSLLGRGGKSAGLEMSTESVTLF